MSSLKNYECDQTSHKMPKTVNADQVWSKQHKIIFTNISVAGYHEYDVSIVIDHYLKDP